MAAMPGAGGGEAEQAEQTEFAVNLISYGDKKIQVIKVVREMTAEEVEASWRLFEAVLAPDLPLRRYEAGSWGPSEADELIARDGRAWSTRLGGRR